MSISGGHSFFNVEIFERCIYDVYFSRISFLIYFCLSAGLLSIFVDTIFFKLDIFHLLLTQYFSRICSPRRTNNQGVVQGIGLAAFPVVCHFMNNCCLEGFCRSSQRFVSLVWGALFECDI